MSEPNVVNDEEQEEQEAQNQNTTSIRPPTRPKSPNSKMAGRTAIKTAVNIVRKVMQIFAAIPLPVKIGILVIILLVFLVEVILETDAKESSSHVTTSVDKTVENSERATDEAKEAYEEYASLLKMPIDAILEIYDYYIEEGEFSGTSIKKSYDYVIGINNVEIKEASSFSKDMEGLVEKAIELAESGGRYYCQFERELVTTIEELDNVKKWDCSSFVYSMYKSFLGINVGTVTGSTYYLASIGNTENGWKAELHSIGDGEMQPGDILYRNGHVGIYVGDNKQVDHGGPGGLCACNTEWRGPKYRDVSSSYTHYIRYTKLE